MSDASWIWDEYWRSGRTASCFTGGSGNYNDEIAAGWRSFFAGCPAKARILDICTGNGAIALLAAEAGLEQRDFEIVGIDRSAIDPAAHAARAGDLLGRIDFRGGIGAERMPFEDSAFDAVVSQYGIEYSDLGQSVPEAARILCEGGRFRFVVHAAEGVPVAESKDAVREVDHLLKDIGLVDAARGAFAAVCAVEREPSPSPAAARDADEGFQRFNHALDGAMDFAETASDGDMVRNSAVVLFDAFEKRRFVDLQVLLDKAREVEDQLRAHRGRSQAMVEAALSSAGAAELARSLSAATGRQAACEPLLIGTGLVGYVVSPA